MPARIDPRKDHATLIRALSQIPSPQKTELRVKLIGEIACSTTQQTLEQSIKSLSLQSIVQQLPPTNNMVPHYQDADIVILPSQSEGFPNVILEAFAAGKPVIVSAAANSAKLVAEGLNGWIFPTGDDHALANLLQKVIRTPRSILELMGEYARQEAEKYPVSLMVDAYTLIYEQLSKDS